MNAYRHFTIWMSVLASIAVGSLAFAYQDKETISLKPTPQHPEASGTAAIGNEKIQIEAKGLKPDSVYTAWFVNTKPEKHETGAGEAPYMFKTDAEGSGAYTAELENSPFGKWEMLMIVLHPNGNPKNMSDMVGALKASLN